MSKIQKMSKNTDFSKVEITRAGYYPAVQRHINSPTWRLMVLLFTPERIIFSERVSDRLKKLRHFHFQIVNWLNEFIQDTGLSPCRWQMNSKMEKAAELLLRKESLFCLITPHGRKGYSNQKGS